MDGVKDGGSGQPVVCHFEIFPGMLRNHSKQIDYSLLRTFDQHVAESLWYGFGG